MPDRKRCTDGATRVAGGGLDPDILERAFAQQATVGDAVKRHASGET